MIFVIFHCEPFSGGWFCKLISSSKNDPREYFPDPIIMGDGSQLFMMDDLTMLKLEIHEL